MITGLNVNIRTTRAGPVIELKGRLDHDTAPDVLTLLPGLALRPGQQLVVDLAQLTFCDSRGISVLVAARNRALAADVIFVLTAVPERVDRIFRITGLEQVFFTCTSAQEADRAWIPPARQPVGPSCNGDEGVT
ncbi:STAS domain-containing protein [Streptomyces sp. NPDC058685]|uniref:STAS domain-containing protein n=1 Tax=Streptomyces sp. NPDC058685 TaxID=3346598 RepID=UPI00365E5C1D